MKYSGTSVTGSRPKSEMTKTKAGPIATFD